MSIFDEHSVTFGEHIALIKRADALLTRLEERVTKLENTQNRAWGVLIGISLISGTIGANIKSLLKTLA
jgi:hypothetical protein